MTFFPYFQVSYIYSELIFKGYILDACLTVPSTHPNPIRTIAYRTNAVSYGVLASGYVRSSSVSKSNEFNPNK